MTLSPRARRGIALGAALVIVAAAAFGLIRTLSSNWDEVQEAWKNADWVLLVAGIVGAMIATALLGQRWHATLIALDARVPLGQAMRWFLVGQMGKYAPGGIWHVVGQGELANRGGVARRTAYASVMIAMMAMIGGAALVVAIGAALPVRSETPWWAVVVGAGIMLVLFEPHVRRKVLTMAHVPEDALPARRLAVLVVGSVPSWLAVGVATWIVVRAFDDHVGLATVALAAVASWLVGIVTLPAPGGIGVREAVLAAALVDELGSGTAALVALVARMAFVIADVTWMVLARALPTSTPADHEPTGAEHAV